MIRKLFDRLDTQKVGYLYGDQMIFFLIVILFEDISKDKIQATDIVDKLDLML